MFRKILVANRGEIAVRVIRACRELGIQSVAVFSEADVGAVHARMATEAVCCGPPRATESYLDIERLVDIARQTGADAVHPGYGFLSENADFAAAVEAAGITFIGPSPAVMREMGQKIAARARMIAAGVPVVPGGERITDVEDATRRAAAIGYPVLVKASAGGGGRGMRRVDAPEELAAAIERASSEAEAAFGDGAVYLEKLLIGPRHIEIQIMADAHGHVIHLGERDCSIQRRHQKLVEEAPAHGMTPGLRSAMGEAAVRAAKAVDYVGAGTCEFLLDASGDFYFLEMNTRIQVEHPVTEGVTGLDLVAMQIRMAAGETLELAQADVELEGHAIEVRIYAEDPDKGFVPSPGPIVGWTDPRGPGLRLDSGFEDGQTVTPHYDPMIAKLIATGADRAEAIERLAAGLETFWIAGIRTGLPFLRRLVVHPVFRAGAYDTSFIEQHMAEPPPPLSDAETDRVLAAVARRAAAESTGSRRFAVALPKTAPATVEVDDDGVRVDGRPVSIEDVAESGVIEDWPAGEDVVRLSLVPRKKGGFDVGLRDRALRVKCEELD